MGKLKTGKALLSSLSVFAVGASIAYIALYPSPVEAKGRIVYKNHEIHVYGHIGMANGRPMPDVRVAMFREFEKTIHGKHIWKWIFVNGTFTNKLGQYSMFAPMHNPNGVRLEMFQRGKQYPIIFHTWALNKKEVSAFDLSVTNKFNYLSAQTFVY